MQIEKSYEENIQISPFIFGKVGITIKSDKNLTTAEELKTHSEKLSIIAKTLVREELIKIKEERQ